MKLEVHFEKIKDFNLYYIAHEKKKNRPILRCISTLFVYSITNSFSSYLISQLE